MSEVIDPNNPPETFWHCSVKTDDHIEHNTANDLTFPELKRTMVGPGSKGKPIDHQGSRHSLAVASGLIRGNARKATK
jgi:hypothetical protein